MCGITGIFSFNLVGKFNKIHTAAATKALAKRGPDFQDVYTDEWIGLGHRRLSVIDTRSIANQPMWDDTGRYTIIFNGEIFNYRELRKSLSTSGVSFRTESDTEVLLKLFIRDGANCLSQLNGFFAFCIYDKQEQSLFLARDRFGVKPLFYLFDEDKFLFASEMKGILPYGIEKTIDYTSLFTFLQLNYIPAPDTIFTTVKKLMPGHFARVRRKEIQIQAYYQIPFHRDPTGAPSYDQAVTQFSRMLEESVQRRLVADVPLGAFLSGGVDSSVIAALAAKHKPDLHTFSIGFKDEPFFDETRYARLVAKKLHTDHTVFSLTNNDLFAHVHSILDHIDEPFADSSAIAIYILSKETRKHATVALSGDGADELLGGYNKHAAFRRALHPGWKENLATMLDSLWGTIPSSRNNRWANVARQLHRFSSGMKMSSKERYWSWAGFSGESTVMKLIHDSAEKIDLSEYETRKSGLLKAIPDKENINDILLTDVRMVLPDDMLTKVDLMSMAHGLEVRTPFLDVHIVDFMFSLPADYKINGTMRKRILQDAFRNTLPPELYGRPKKGFEVPLLKWFRNEMKGLIVDELLSEKFITEQRIFNYPEIDKLKRQLFSSNPGDVHARIWGLIVFQWWWRKYFV